MIILQFGQDPENRLFFQDTPIIKILIRLSQDEVFNII